MTVQAWRLLKKLKKAQINEDREFGIIFDEMKIVTLHDSTQSYKTVEIKGYGESIHSVLDHLAQSGYISCDDQGNGQVLHNGWHLRQTTISRICIFLFQSIAVPIVVSFLTAVITMLLSGSLQLS